MLLVVRVPVKLVDWDEIVLWSKGLSDKIKESGWTPNVVVAVSRGGFVPARLICDFLDISDLLSIQSQHWVEAAKAAEKAILKYPYHIDLDGKDVLIVDDIVDTGDTLSLAKDFVEKEWGPRSVKTATLQWISSVAKFKPDYYYIEVKDWTWFQYPWTRLEDIMQFILRILREDDRAKNRPITINELESLFNEWYGLRKDDIGFYWDLAMERLKEKGYINMKNDLISLVKS